MLVLTFILAWGLHGVLNERVQSGGEILAADPAFFPPEAMWMVQGVPGTGSVCRVVVKCPQAVLEPVEGGVAVRMIGQAGPLPAGCPDLPVFTRGVNGSADRALKARIVHAEYSWSTQNVDVAAVETRETTAPNPVRSETRMVRRRSNVIYGMDRFWPDTPVEISESMMGASNLARVAVCPVQVNPKQRLLRACRQVEFELYYEP
jgi:hypothetical protein